MYRYIDMLHFLLFSQLWSDFDPDPLPWCVQDARITLLPYVNYMHKIIE